MNPTVQTGPSRVESFLTRIVRLRHWVIALGALLIALSLAAALNLRKDTSADAFLDPSNPALRYRKQVAEVFGLKDPVVIAVRRQGADGVFNPRTLELVRSITAQLPSVPNVDPDGITSLATERAIDSGPDGMQVDRLLEPEGPIDAAHIEWLKGALDDMPLYEGVLVSKDRSATLIVAELIDERASTDTYQHITTLAESLVRDARDEVFVSGEGAVGGYLSTYIDNDAHRLVPLAGVVIAFVLFAAFCTLRGVLAPLLIVLATLTLTLGSMASVNVAYFAITNGMAVALIGIAVADSVHVFSEYYTQMRLRPRERNERLIVIAMTQIWNPIGLTSITTAAGFLSLYFTNSMPPIRYFGLFGAVGVTAAWIYTVTVLPAIIACLPKRQSRFFRDEVGHDDILKRTVLFLGRYVVAWPRTVLALVCVLLGVGVLGVQQLRMDYERIGNFDESEPLHQADREINRTFAGTYHMDIVIEASQPEGLLEPDALRRIEALQIYLQTIPPVGATRSIVDYVKQMNRALNEDRAEAYAIPDDSMLTAQLFLAYQASAEPTALERMLDSAHQTALVRVYLNAGRWSEQREAVSAARRYIDEHFADGELTATATGRVVVDDVWMQGIGDGHFASVAASLLAVFAMCALLFRSIKRGLLAVIPNVVATFCVYAVMGFQDIWLGVATSMFASVAIGAGVDFAIHTLDRVKQARVQSSDIDHNLMFVYHSTGRALIFNTAAVACGFGVVMFSSVPPIRLFGALVAAGICAAYFASLTALPALLKVLHQRRERGASLAPQAVRASVVLLAAIVIGGLSAPRAYAESTLSPKDIMQRVADRPDGDTAQRTVRIQLIDRRGVVREQVTRAFRKRVDGERRTAIFYLEPANVRGTAFLTYDYADAEDDQWLYLPALRKVRRVPAAERGDYFLGTDLSYEEVRNDNRVTLTDWTFISPAPGKSTVDGAECLLVEGAVASPAIARELRYSRARWCIDAASWISRRTDYWDQSGNHLKTIDNRELELIDSVWTPRRIEAANHKTGHRTVLIVSEIDFGAPVRDQLFTQQQLARGL